MKAYTLAADEAVHQSMIQPDIKAAEQNDKIRSTMY